jgi:hypothetical protein
MSVEFERWFLTLREKRLLDADGKLTPKLVFCPICGAQRCDCAAKVVQYILFGGAAPWEK